MGINKNIFLYYMMYKKIINPLTNQPVNLDSKLGKSILNNYSVQLAGSSHEIPKLCIKRNRINCLTPRIGKSQCHWDKDNDICYSGRKRILSGELIKTTRKIHKPKTNRFRSTTKSIIASIRLFKIKAWKDKLEEINSRKLNQDEIDFLEKSIDKSDKIVQRNINFIINSAFELYDKLISKESYVTTPSKFIEENNLHINMDFKEFVKKCKKNKVEENFMLRQSINLLPYGLFAMQIITLSEDFYRFAVLLKMVNPSIDLTTQDAKNIILYYWFLCESNTSISENNIKLSFFSENSKFIGKNLLKENIKKIVTPYLADKLGKKVTYNLLETTLSNIAALVGFSTMGTVGALAAKGITNLIVIYTLDMILQTFNVSSCDCIKKILEEL